MIYKRHHSIEVTLDQYEVHFGSLVAAKEQCYNIGAGTWQHDAWTNIDLAPQSAEFAKIQAPCIFHDLVESDDLPIGPGSAALMYTSHVVEHLPDYNASKLFESVYKTLKEGGIFRVVTGPDADTDFAALLRQDPFWWYFYGDDEFEDAVAEFGSLSVKDKWLLHFATPRSYYSNTPCDRKYSTEELGALIEEYRSDPTALRDILTDELPFNVNYPGDHLSWWNGCKLIRKLRDAGFKTVDKCAYGQSRSHFMRDLNSFDTTYPQISVYVEAVK